MKKLITFSLVVLCCIQVSLACIYIGPYQKFIINDRSTNLPLEGTTITILYQNKPVRHITLDSSGTFFMYLWREELAHKLIIKHDGYIGLEQSLKVSEDNNMVITVWLSTAKRAKMEMREFERYRRNTLSALTAMQLEEHLTQSVSTDQAYHTISCNMKHLNRKDQTRLSTEGTLFNEVILYPNPATSGSPLFVESKFDERKLLVIYNMEGMELLRTEIVYHSRIETSTFKPGIYILKVIDSKNEEVVTQKFLIQ